MIAMFSSIVDLATNFTHVFVENAMEEKYEEALKEKKGFIEHFLSIQKLVKRLLRSF
jgi:hypothetical protein